MRAHEPAATLSIGATAGGRVAAAETRLRGVGDPSPRLDAELLVALAFERDRAWLHAHPEAVLDPAATERVEGWIDRRAAGEPVAYIRGFKEWLSLRVVVDARALIPRPETELLADLAIAEIATRLVAQGSPIAAWEVGTGSGAIATALALRFRAPLALGRLRLTASDLSPDALELAAENLAGHGVAGMVALACGDLLDPATPGERFDLLVANLPYVPSAEVTAAGGSLAWEPRRALDGGPDGLDLLRRLVAQLPSRLAAGGAALLEIGAGQASAIRTMTEARGTALTTTFHRDLAGHERVAQIVNAAA